MGHTHILLLLFPAHGAITPSLQFAKNLIRIGVKVTVATTIFAHRCMITKTSQNLEGLTIATFSDGYDDGFKDVHKVDNFLSEFNNRGSQALEEIMVPVLRKATQSRVLVQSSVVYVSFGTNPLVALSKRQREEIARGLLKSHRPFLWAIKAIENGEKHEDKLSCSEELEQLGMIVPWCSQVDVLSHPSLGCFFTHCGWNSTLESLVSGVPMVGFPHFTDQPTNAKLIEDVFRTGVRVKVNEEEIVEADEITRCIEVIMGGGEVGEELKRNAKKWKDLAKEATKEGGSSDMNLRAFVEEMEA
ncbi:UDP-glucosyltransferase 75B1 [Actinidia rufa]|uniref:UDP-glucosyltransferase 75B1 n=1 Tax=Actinidia rufa TaxID=165716 RepID=A0A7J0F2W0_9ERIC|nr:UDP-glucosyltransferase 75B1 [Actinidia rufa]